MTKATNYQCPELVAGQLYRLSGMLFKADEWLNPYTFVGIDAAEDAGYLLVFKSVRNGTDHYEPAYGVQIKIHEVHE